MKDEHSNEAKDARQALALRITQGLYREMRRILSDSETVSISAGTAGIIGVLGAFFVQLNDNQPVPTLLAEKMKSEARDTLERALIVFERYRADPKRKPDLGK